MSPMVWDLLVLSLDKHRRGWIRLARTVILTRKEQWNLCMAYSFPGSYLSTAMATKVKTEAETEIPWTIPFILHTVLPKGHPAV